VALHDNPRHRASLYSVASGTDNGGGTTLAYTLAQSAIAVSINTASASTQELFAQQNIVVTHTIGVLTSKLTSTPQRGWKVVADDTSDAYHVEGIRRGRQSPNGSIPALTYLQVRQIM
jgi:hypothetical protein